MGYHVGSEQTRVHAGVVFAEGATDRSAVSDWANGSDAFLGGTPTVRTDGRVVTATAQVATGDVTEFPGEFPGPEIETGPPTAASDSETVTASSSPPAASFDFHYEETADGVGLLMITHAGGEIVKRTALGLRGTGFTDVDGADQTSPGTWQGGAEDDGGVYTGHTVRVGVRSDYEIEVVWEPSNSDTSAVLDAGKGPDA
ncbi:hypothetical protein ACFQL4_19340 [Halosimplex aquaticum]